tara:strand:+ start:226 stop:879 length:654 start_codon:yes stop_codon:yes gene_type:complete
MKAKIFISFILSMYVALFTINAQRGYEMTPYQEYLLELKELRKNCRNALKPYRYDGSNTTHFAYKEYNYAKEVEIATVMNEEYRLSFNSIAVKNDPITVRIYDKGKKYNSRVLLYEKTDVAGTEFTVETTEMVEKLKKARLDAIRLKKSSSALNEEQWENKFQQDSIYIDKLRLKKIYLNYIIPATDREIEVDPETGKDVKVVTKGAVIMAVGYNNL